MASSFNYRDVQQVHQFSTPQSGPSSTTAQRHGNTETTPYSGARELSAYADGAVSESGKTKTRKARITLDDSDYLVIMRACVSTISDYTTDSKKSAYWDAVRNELLRQTGKDLALPKQVVERLMRDRHFYLESHPEERGKSDDEITDLTDQWIEHIENIAGSDSAEARWKLPPNQDRRVKVPGMRSSNKETADTPSSNTPILPPQQPPVTTLTGSRTAAQASPTIRPPKRSREDGPAPIPSRSGPLPSGARAPEAPMGQMESMDRVLDSMDTLFGPPSSRSNEPPSKRPRLGDNPEVPQRVVVEGALTKEDWLEVLAQVKTNDPRIPALEAKVDTLIETTKRTHQMLIQLLKNQARRPVNGAELVSINSDVNGSGE